MTLLELIQQVTAELALNQPIAIIGSTDPQVKQFLALVNRLGADIAKQYDWQRLDKEYIVETVSTTLTGTTTIDSPIITGISSTASLSTQFAITGVGVQNFSQILSVDNGTQVTMTMEATASGTVSLVFAQVQYNLPSDWDRQIPQTEWDRTNRWPLMGPQSPQDWQSFKSGIVYAGPRERFRILGQTLALSPPPPDGLTLAYEYMSKNWVNSALGVGKSSFTVDTDTCVFTDSLMVTGLKTQWKMAKGLDATFDLAEFQNLLDTNKAQDKSAPKLSLSPYQGNVLLSMANVADGNWIG